MIKENYIKRLEREKQDALAALTATNLKLAEIQSYLLSAKFSGVDSDYVHVRTDILPKITEARLQTVIF